MKTLATLLAVLGTLSVQAQGIIWSADNWQQMSGAPGASWEIAFDQVSDPFFATPPGQNPTTGIFSMSLLTNDTGRTFVANTQNEPGFDGFVAGLTDGENDYIRMQAPDHSTWRSQSEKDFLGRSSLAPDLAGYNITQIGLRINNYYDWYYAPEDRYFRTLEYSLDFHGTLVPEPSTYALLTLGAAALLVRRKARRGRRL